MNLVNRQVLHKAFGSGNLVEHPDGSVNLMFSSGVKKFLFPDAFGDYLQLVDHTAAEAVNRYVQAAKQAIESTAIGSKSKTTPKNA